MSKQRIEIEVDVPDGWEATGEWRQALRGEPFLGTDGKSVRELALADRTDYPCLILRRIEPKRDSRWGIVHEEPKGTGYASREEAESAARDCFRVERLDYVDGKLVSVALEPVTAGEGES